MTNARYRKIINTIESLELESKMIDRMHDEETTQRQNFGQHMEDDAAICKRNEKALMEAMVLIQSAIEQLKQIDH